MLNKTCDVMRGKALVKINPWVRLQPPWHAVRMTAGAVQYDRGDVQDNLAVGACQRSIGDLGQDFQFDRLILNHVPPVKHVQFVGACNAMTTSDENECTSTPTSSAGLTRSSHRDTIVLESRYTHVDSTQQLVETTYVSITPEGRESAGMNAGTCAGGSSRGRLRGSEGSGRHGVAVVRGERVGPGAGGRWLMQCLPSGSRTRKTSQSMCASATAPPTRSKMRCSTTMHPSPKTCAHPATPTDLGESVDRGCICITLDRSCSDSRTH